MGTIRVRSFSSALSRGWCRDRRDARRRRGWGGAAVVLRAGESPRTWGRAAACHPRKESNVRRRTGEYRCRHLAGSVFGRVDGTENADQIAPLAVIRSSETADGGGWKGPGHTPWSQLNCPMVGAIPAPHGAWRKSDVLMAATGYQCCGSRDVTGITGDLDVRDASSRLPMVRRRTHARTVVSSIRPTRGSGSGPQGHGPSGRIGPSVSARASAMVARQTVRTYGQRQTDDSERSNPVQALIGFGE